MTKVDDDEARMRVLLLDRDRDGHHGGGKSDDVSMVMEDDDDVFSPYRIKSRMLSLDSSLGGGQLASLFSKLVRAWGSNVQP